MDDLRSVLARAVEDFRPDGSELDRPIERARRRQRRTRVIAGLTALAVAGAGIGLAVWVFSTGLAPRPAGILEDRNVAFVSDQDGDGEIYAIGADGSPTNLTDNDVDNRAPAWSPDGARIAFLRREGNAYYVWVMNADGTDARRVTEPGPGDVVAGEVSGDSMWSSRLSWSPEGTRIAFGGRETGLPCPAEGCAYLDLDIFSVGVDVPGPVNLTHTTQTDEWDPAWAPDDDTIVFVRADRKGGEPPHPERIPQLYIMSADAPGVGRLTNLPGSAVSPAWSPDGTRIAFESDGDVYVMNADGTGLRRLAVLPPEAESAAPHPSYGNYEPAWSPDGTRIVFASDRDAGRDLYVMPADGTEDQAVRLTDLSGDEWQPAWRPARSPEPAREVFFPTWSGEERPAAIVTGTLTERDRCLFLRSDGQEVLALWEEGYSYASGVLRDSLDRPVVRVGDTLHGGGGYGSDWQHAERLVGEPMPSRCRPEGAEPYALIYHVKAGPPAAETHAPSSPSPPTGVDWCKGGGQTLEADLDGDGLRDLVSLRFVQGYGPGGVGQAVLGICTGAGDVDEFPTAGQAEELDVTDVQPDGQDEIFFGGNTCCAAFLQIGVVVDGRIHEVVLPDSEALGLVDGIQSNVTGGGSASRAIGCEDVDGDGEREVVQATVESINGVLHWTKDAYRIDGTDATWIWTDSGTLGEGEIDWDTAKKLTKPCGLRGKG